MAENVTSIVERTEVVPQVTNHRGSIIKIFENARLFVKKTYNGKLAVSCSTSKRTIRSKCLRNGSSISTSAKPCLKSLICSAESDPVYGLPPRLKMSY